MWYYYIVYMSPTAGGSHVIEGSSVFESHSFEDIWKNM